MVLKEIDIIDRIFANNKEIYLIDAKVTKSKEIDIIDWIFALVIQKKI